MTRRVLDLGAPVSAADSPGSSSQVRQRSAAQRDAARAARERPAGALSGPGSRPEHSGPRPPAEQLLWAAEELFAERGYRQTTVAQICALAGIATGSFYAHFRSKAEIFAAVVRRINADLSSAMREAIGGAGGQRELERACFHAFFEMLSRRPRTDQIVRESEFVAPALFREHYERLARDYARGVRQAQLAGQVDVRYDPEVIAYILAGIGHFIRMRWADWTAGGHVREELLDEVLAMLACGLTPRGNGCRQGIEPAC
jgi:AcrR family transcriptional regulator